MSASRFSCFAASLLTLAIAVPAWSQSPGTAPANSFEEALKQRINRSGQVSTPPVTVNPIPNSTGSSSKPACVQCEAASLQLDGESCCAGCGAVAASPIRKTYSLAEICDDPSFGAWVAEMIPQVVQPGSWNKGDTQNRHVLSYFAPAKMLLVYHTPAAHAEIDDMLRGMKKSLPTTRATASKAPAHFGLAQAGYSVPEPRTEPAPAPNGYPVAAPVHQPRHLFHFIIRYEGDGIIDQNVAEFAKVYSDAAVASATAAVNQAPASPTKSDAPEKEAPATMLPPIAAATPHAPGSVSPQSAPATARSTPAPAPNYPAPATAPASRDDEEE